MMKHLTVIAMGALLGACLPHPPPPAAPYRAVGQGAASWTLIIDDRNITFIPATGQQPVLQPAVRPISGVAGDIYQTQRINVNVVHSPCNDRRTDRIYPDSVQVYVDRRLHTGCGGL